MSDSQAKSSLLSALRREELVVPDASFLELTPVAWDLEPGRAYWRDRWKRQQLTTKLKKGRLSERWLVLDLDDTLLMGSFTTKEEWGELGNAFPGLERSAMRTDWWATTKRLLKGKRERIACRQAHPFLNHPPVEVAFRPGMVEGLMELKAQGLGLVLVTASARTRVEFLLQRFPVLAELFAGDEAVIVPAESMAESSMVAESAPEAVDCLPSARAHEIRSRSLAVKTPWAVSRAAGIPAYDLLIDDSKTTAKVFDEAGLGDKLLAIEGQHPCSGYGIHILDTTIQRLLKSGSGTQTSGPLPCSLEFSQTPAGIPLPPKVEDPLYFPLLHYTDQF